MTAPASTRPPKLPVPDGYSVAITYDVNGQPAVVVLGVTAGSQSDAVAAATTTAGTFHQYARPLMSSLCTWKGTTLYAADGSGYSTGLALPLPAGQSIGTYVSGSGPGNLITAYATLLKWLTPGPGRSGKGRTFVPGFVTGLLNPDGRTLSSTAVTAAQTLASKMIDPALAPGFSVISHRHGAHYPVQTGNAATVVGIQRRRIRN